MEVESMLSKPPQVSPSLSCLPSQAKVIHATISPPDRHADPRLSVFAFGSGEKGQLGNGTTGERISTGNKTAYDIESEPSRVAFSPSSV